MKKFQRRKFDEKNLISGLERNINLFENFILFSEKAFVAGKCHLKDSSDSTHSFALIKKFSLAYFPQKRKLIKNSWKTSLKPAQHESQT